MFFALVLTFKTFSLSYIQKNFNFFFAISINLLYLFDQIIFKFDKKVFYFILMSLLQKIKKMKKIILNLRKIYSMMLTFKSTQKIIKKSKKVKHF